MFRRFRVARRDEYAVGVMSASSESAKVRGRHRARGRPRPRAHAVLLVALVLALAPAAHSGQSRARSRSPLSATRLATGSGAAWPRSRRTMPASRPAGARPLRQEQHRPHPAGPFRLGGRGAADRRKLQAAAVRDVARPQRPPVGGGDRPDHHGELARLSGEIQGAHHRRAQERRRQQAPVCSGSGFRPCAMSPPTRTRARRTGCLPRRSQNSAISAVQYVEPWQLGDADDDKFASYGPDLNGRMIQIRASDGEHFTPAGDRWWRPICCPKSSQLWPGRTARVLCDQNEGQTQWMAVRWAGKLGMSLAAGAAGLAGPSWDLEPARLDHAADLRLGGAARACPHRADGRGVDLGATTALRRHHPRRERRRSDPRGAPCQQAAIPGSRQWRQPRLVEAAPPAAETAPATTEDEPPLDAELVDPAIVRPPPAARRPAHQGKRGLVILQIGDSHTSADFLTGELRRRLQARYGRGGPGYMHGRPSAYRRAHLDRSRSPRRRAGPTSRCRRPTHAPPSSGSPATTRSRPRRARP